LVGQKPPRGKGRADATKRPSSLLTEKGGKAGNRKKWRRGAGIKEESHLLKGGGVSLRGTAERGVGFAQKERALSCRPPWEGEKGQKKQEGFGPVEIDTNFVGETFREGEGMRRDSHKPTHDKR